MLLVNAELQEEAGLSPGNVKHEPSLGVGLRLLCLRKPHRLTLITQRGKLGPCSPSAGKSQQRPAMAGDRFWRCRRSQSSQELKEHLIK